MGDIEKITAGLLLLIAVVAAMILMPSHANSAIISGSATVVNAGTLTVSGKKLYLKGLYAPAKSKKCLTLWHKKGGRHQSWACGQAAAQALQKRIGQRKVACRTEDTGRFAECYIKTQGRLVSLNAWMLRQGWAASAPRQGMRAQAQQKTLRRFKSYEQQARRAQKGLWRAQGRPLQLTKLTIRRVSTNVTMILAG